MIVLSAGMQKAGSGYWFNLTNDLLIACGKGDIRKLRDEHRLGAILRHHNCLIKNLERENLAPLEKLHLLGNTFAIKTHRPPGEAVRDLMSRKMMKTTYIYRDPRDALLSAIDSGEKSRKNGGSAFVKFTTVEGSIGMVKKWLRNWDEWTAFDGVLLTRYEDLISDPVGQLRRLACHLSIDTTDAVLRAVVSNYEKAILRGKPPGELHFNKGIAGRYKDAMDGRQLELCNRHFGEHIEKMGYELKDRPALSDSSRSPMVEPAKVRRQRNPMRKLAHIVNPLKADPSSDLRAAQPVTFETMRKARQFARDKVDITLYSAQYSDDADFVPEDFAKTKNLERSVLDCGEFHIPRKLPLLKDILDRLYDESDAEYFIYTNVDIGLMPYFYVAVNRIIEDGHDAFVVNRRTISERFAHIEEIPLMYSDLGTSHKGYDCFVFKRAAYPEYRLGSSCLGAPWVGKILIWNLALHSEKFKIFKESHLTFHIGNSSIWRMDKFSDYSRHNKQCACQVLEGFEKNQSNIEKLESFDLIRGFESCAGKDGMRKQLFVAGLHKSGTSLLFKCLREHPSISGFHDTDVPQDEGQFLQTVFPSAMHFGGPGIFGFNSNMHLTERSKYVTDANKRKLLSEWSRFWDTSRPVLLEKSPPNLLKTRFLQAMFPRPYFVAITRHPIAVSYSTRQWSKTSIIYLLNHWLQCHRIFSEDRNFLRHCLVVRYEDFVRSPNDWMKTICDFVGIEYRPVALDVKKDMNDRYFDLWTLEREQEQMEKFSRGPDARKMETEFRKFGYSLQDPKVIDSI